MSRKTQQREVGSDRRDAYLIADMGFSHTVSKTSPTEEELSDLQRLCRLERELTSDLVRKKNQLRSSLDVVNPAYGKVFSKTSLYTKGSLALLERYVLPDEYLSEDPGILAEIYNKAARKRSGEARITQLKTSMAVSVPVQYAKDAHAYAVRVKVRQIRSLQEEISSVKKRVLELCEDWREVVILSSLPGVSPMRAAKILGESGNPSRFKNGSAYVAWFGLDPKGKSSADYVTQKKMSKAGSPLGRYEWIQATRIAIRRSPYFHRAAERKFENLGRNPRIVELYRHDKNRRRVKAVKEKIVMCAVAAKMARTGFALLRENRTYNEHHEHHECLEDREQKTQKPS
jgi:hypothetical protein